jgi:serine/threonine-protein kinase RsbW
MPDDIPDKCEFNPDELILRLDLSLPADVNEIDPVVQRILIIVSSMECGSGKEFEVETALREALANAVVHGCQKDPEKKIQVAVACDASRGMLIIVRDPGTGFDPAAIPSPTTGQNIFRAHGRGIYLINELMDEVRFEKGGTEIWMRKE